MYAVNDDGSDVDICASVTAVQRIFKHRVINITCRYFIVKRSEERLSEHSSAKLDVVDKSSVSRGTR